MTDVLRSVALEPSLPSSAYTDPAQFAAEKDKIFTREWMVACRAEEVAGVGAWKVVDLVGESILLVRGKDGVLNAFYNVCRHRGAQLCPSAGEPKPGRAALPIAVTSTGLIRCPYHAWTYSSAGDLIGAPFLSDDPDFRRGDFSLYPVGCEQWGGFVFLHLTPAKAEPLHKQIGGVAGRIANYPLADLRVGHRITYEVDANWKILCENYNECYHCGPLHPELCAIVPAFRAAGGAGLEWERGVPHRDGATTFTWSGTTDRAPFPDLNEDERTRHKGELNYPNLFLSLAADHVTAYILWPLSASSTQVECLFLFAQDEMRAAAFDHTDASGFWEVVNQQDWAICERVQQGMGSRAHRQGFYAPMEDANLDMRCYMEARMSRS
ncbi:MAG TPA: aromatic ring-hydroxylating dioxygenase subunit alpha [Caulobacteraceae bacterium]|jgi:Rieske 2Fe-2S family protein